MDERPLIIVSNDDGYLSRGLNVLADALEELGEVWVVAPERARSAVGHSISLHKPLRLKSYAERRYWCSGSPTDSVYLGINHVIPRTATMLVSGINIGPNLGDDVTYSGTVAAAMEGTLLEVPSLAVSLSGRTTRGVEGAAALAVQVGREIMRHGLPEACLLNLNVPHEYEVSKGLQLTTLGKRRYSREVVVKQDPRGRDYYWIGGPDIGFADLPGSDCNAVDQGYASLTPLHLDLTLHTQLKPLQGWDLRWSAPTS